MIGAIILFIFGAASIGLVLFMKNYIDLSSNPSFVWFHIGFIALGVVLIVWGIDRVEKEYGFLNALLDKRDRRQAEIAKEERDRIDKETGGLLTKAAKGDASAQNSLALCFYHGDGVKADYQKAVYWYTKAAEQGQALAQCNLGSCFYHGEGVAKDPKKAVYWFTKAAEQGEALAQYNLGSCFCHGEGVAKDYQKAVYWYTKAAEQGEALAQYNLGFCYEHGYGVTKNMDTAIQLYKKAASGGSDDAKQALKRLQV